MQIRDNIYTVEIDTSFVSIYTKEDKQAKTWTTSLLAWVSRG